VESKPLVRSIIALAVLSGGGLAYRAYTSRSTAPAARPATGDAKPADGKAPAGKDPAAAAADRVVPVVASPVAQRDMPIYLEGIGNVLAWATVTVRTQVDGRIDKIAFQEGQEVHKGDLLAQIDPRPFENQLHTADATRIRDSAQLAGAKRTLERDRALLKDGLTSQQTVDDQEVAVAAAQATLGVDQAAIDAARLSLDYAHITSPIDGVTGIRLVDQGNIIHASDPSGIVVITQLDPIAVVFTLPQDDLAPISKEMGEGTVAVEAMSRDGATKLATGSLVLIDNQINQATATIRLKAKFPNPDHKLWPNAFVKTRLLLATRKNALVVKSAVVQRGPQGTFAYVVGADNKAEVRPITVDVSEGELTIVSSGLKPGEMVVEDGQYQLRQGAKVSVSPPASEAEGKAIAQGKDKPAGSAAPAGSAKAGKDKKPGDAKAAQ
jgi:multidrug efflux system membrane fusion protein